MTVAHTYLYCMGHPPVGAVDLGSSRSSACLLVLCAVDRAEMDTSAVKVVVAGDGGAGWDNRVAVCSSTLPEHTRTRVEHATI